MRKFIAVVVATFIFFTSFNIAKAEDNAAANCTRPNIKPNLAIPNQVPPTYPAPTNPALEPMANRLIG